MIGLRLVLIWACKCLKICDSLLMSQANWSHISDTFDQIGMEMD